MVEGLEACLLRFDFIVANGKVRNSIMSLSVAGYDLRGIGAAVRYPDGGFRDRSAGRIGHCAQDCAGRALGR